MTFQKYITRCADVQYTLDIYTFHNYGNSYRTVFAMTTIVAKYPK